MRYFKIILSFTLVYAVNFFEDKETKCKPIVVYDFDETISKEHAFIKTDGTFQRSFTDEEAKIWMGNEDRIEDLRKHFQALVDKNVSLYIFSFTVKDTIDKILKICDFENFFPEGHVFAGDWIPSKAPEKSEWHHPAYSKAEKILELFNNGEKVIFADDCTDNFDEINQNPHKFQSTIKKTIEVRKATGLSKENMEEIEQFIHGICNARKKRNLY